MPTGGGQMPACSCRKRSGDDTGCARHHPRWKKPGEETHHHCPNQRIKPARPGVFVLSFDPSMDSNEAIISEHGQVAS